MPNNTRSTRMPRDHRKCHFWGLAAEALMEEAKVGARRAEIMGPSGWIKPRETINKRFLHSTLRNVVLSNRHKQKREKYREARSTKAANHSEPEKVLN